MKKMSGLYDPPHEVDEMKICRLVGPGWLGVAPDGLTLGGTLVDRPVHVPFRLIGVLALLAGLAATVVTGAVDTIMPPTVVVVMSAIGLGAWSERAIVAPHRLIPWSKVERVVRYPMDPDRFAVLLEPLPDWPETVYFNATEGPEALLAALREAAPGLHIETEAAEAAIEERENYVPPEDDDEILIPDHGPRPPR